MGVDFGFSVACNVGLVRLRLRACVCFGLLVMFVLGCCLGCA